MPTTAFPATEFALVRVRGLFGSFRSTHVPWSKMPVRLPGHPGPVSLDAAHGLAYLLLPGAVRSPLVQQDPSHPGGADIAHDPAGEGREGYSNVTVTFRQPARSHGAQDQLPSLRWDRTTRPSCASRARKASSPRTKPTRSAWKRRPRRAPPSTCCKSRGLISAETLVALRRTPTLRRGTARTRPRASAPPPSCAARAPPPTRWPRPGSPRRARPSRSPAMAPDPDETAYPRPQPGPASPSRHAGVPHRGRLGSVRADPVPRPGRHGPGVPRARRAAGARGRHQARAPRRAPAPRAAALRGPRAGPRRATSGSARSTRSARREGQVYIAMQSIAGETLGALAEGADRGAEGAPGAPRRLARAPRGAPRGPRPPRRQARRTSWCERSRGRSSSGPYVMDTGLARSLRSRTRATERSGSTMGTPATCPRAGPRRVALASTGAATSTALARRSTTCSRPEPAQADVLNDIA